MISKTNEHRLPKEDIANRTSRMACGRRKKILVMLHIRDLVQISVFSLIKIYVCWLRHVGEQSDEEAEKAWKRAYLRTASEGVGRKARELRGSLDLP